MDAGKAWKAYAPILSRSCACTDNGSPDTARISHPEAWEAAENLAALDVDLAKNELGPELQVALSRACFDFLVGGSALCPQCRTPASIEPTESVGNQWSNLSPTSFHDPLKRPVPIGRM